MSHIDPNVPPTADTPLIPPTVRTVLYVVGTLAGFATPVLAGVSDLAAGISGAVAGACAALAFGYRPTR